MTRIEGIRKRRDDSTCLHIMVTEDGHEVYAAAPCEFWPRVATDIDYLLDEVTRLRSFIGHVARNDQSESVRCSAEAVLAEVVERAEAKK